MSRRHRSKKGSGQNTAETVEKPDEDKNIEFTEESADDSADKGEPAAENHAETNDETSAETSDEIRDKTTDKIIDDAEDKTVGMISDETSEDAAADSKDVSEEKTEEDDSRHRDVDDEYETEQDYPVYHDEAGDGRGYEPADDGNVDDRESEEDARRRTRRHRRRIEQRNAAIITTVILAAATFLIVLGVRKLGAVVGKHQAAVAEASVIASESAAEASSIVLAEPSTETASEETESVDYLQNVVDSCIKEMPLEDKVAQLFVVTPEQLTGAKAVQQAGDATQAALSKNAVGGIIYFKQNLKDKEQVTEMLKGTSAMSKYPLFLAIDEEGGNVSRVAEAGIDGSVKVDSEADIAKGGDTSKAEEAGETIGSYLSALGFNLDLAPVADVVTDVSKSSIGDRSYGADPQTDGQMAAAMTQGLQKTGVSACLKHFPGIGDAQGDTHKQKVEITETIDEMKQKNFVPFKAGIDAGADFVMAGHGDVSVADTSAEYMPACLSKKMVTDELRGELGFDGIVITDAMNMEAISDYFGADEAAVKAVQAGVDMILMPEDYEKAYNGILTAVKDGTITEDRINESLTRIYRVKYADKINDDTKENEE